MVAMPLLMTTTRSRSTKYMVEFLVLKCVVFNWTYSKFQYFIFLVVQKFFVFLSFLFHFLLPNPEAPGPVHARLRVASVADATRNRLWGW